MVRIRTDEGKETGDIVKVYVYMTLETECTGAGVNRDEDKNSIA